MQTDDNYPKLDYKRDTSRTDPTFYVMKDVDLKKEGRITDESAVRVIIVLRKAARLILSSKSLRNLRVRLPDAPTRVNIRSKKGPSVISDVIRDRPVGIYHVPGNAEIADYLKAGREKTIEPKMWGQPIFYQKT